MNKTITLTILLSALVLSSCSKSPKDRMVSMCKTEEQNEEDRKGCICTAEKLETKLSEEKYKKLVDALEEEKKNKGSDKNILNSGALDQDVTMAFMGAAKECATEPQRKK